MFLQSVIVTGTVSELWRYPTKSLVGERLQQVRLDERGIVGDRLFAVTDRNGKIGSGKATKRFRRFRGPPARRGARERERLERPGRSVHLFRSGFRRRVASGSLGAAQD
jgi:uncharacterized protein